MWIFHRMCLCGLLLLGLQLLELEQTSVRLRRFTSDIWSNNFSRPPTNTQSILEVQHNTSSMLESWLLEQKDAANLRSNNSSQVSQSKKPPQKTIFARYPPRPTRMTVVPPRPRSDPWVNVTSPACKPDPETHLPQDPCCHGTACCPSGRAYIIPSQNVTGPKIQSFYKQPLSFKQTSLEERRSQGLLAAQVTWSNETEMVIVAPQIKKSKYTRPDARHADLAWITQQQLVCFGYFTS